jgi:subfamily B ATP-binding cassette protein MsbA
VRNAIFSTLQRQSLKFYGNIDIGELISRCVNDTASIEYVLAHTVASAARAPFEILAVIIWAAKYSVENGIGRFVLAIGVFLPLCVLPIIILGQRVKRWTKKSLERISLVVSRMHENFTGIRVVKAFNTEKYEEDRFHALNLSYFRAVVKTFKAEILMSPLMESVIAVIGMAFLVICFILRVDLVKIAMVGTAVYLSYKPLKEIAQISAWLQRGAAALGRIFALLDTDTSLPEPVNPVAKKGFEDKIVFDHVDFSFSPEGPEVVHDACFEVPRGSLVALVGETGSGKSTYANLLARFYDPTSGKVTLDGVDLRQIATSDLRALIGVVTQDTILFNDTIANNIAYGTEGATMEQIEAAAKMANAHEFIVAHPEGYGRVCGDKGFLLSGGEKQRIALARAILRNPPILILDEATSALDPESEQIVQENLASIARDRTVLVIAHRLSMVRRANRILVIDAGKVVGLAPHDVLVHREGLYRDFWQQQMGGGR